MNNHLEISGKTLLEEIILTLQNDASTEDLVRVSNVLSLYNITGFDENQDLITIVG